MPNLNILMSIGTILLLIFWFVSPGLVLGWRHFKVNRPAILLAGLFVLHVIWLFNTQDFAYALKDLRIKLPLLAFAVVLGSIPISKEQLKLIFLSLSIGIWVATIKGYFRYFDLPEGMHDHRQIVSGISHIRLGLLMVMQVVGVIYFWKEISLSVRIYSVFVVVNTIVFFNVMQSATGVIILLVVLPITVIFLWAGRNKKLLYWPVAALLLILAVGIAYSAHYYNSYFVSEEPLLLEPETEMGNPYWHFEAGVVENGYYSFHYLTENEMDEAWNERSHIKIGSDADSVRDVSSTLIRYLTSKGLRKDRKGVMALTDADVKNIEMGFPNELYANNSGLALRYHSLMFGLHVFLKTGDPTGLSFFQRVVYWKAAAHLIGENFWLGTGTGDVAMAFEKTHSILNPNLAKRYWLRAHNQFLTFFATFGIVGFLYFLYLFGYTLFVRRYDFLSVAFLIVAFISCLTEDTLETQAGVTFFAFFFALLSKPILTLK